jgi:hypothetical protein
MSRPASSAGKEFETAGQAEERVAPPDPADRLNLRLPAMNMTAQPSGEKALPISKTYWVCQAVGWSLLMLFGLLSQVVFNSNEHIPISRLVVAVTLICCSGLAITHLVHLEIRRRRWLEMPLRKVWPRLVAAVALAAMLMTVVNVVNDIFVTPSNPQRPVSRPGVLLVMWFNYGAILSFWLAFYLAIHEFRRRRAAEVQTLQLELVAQEAQLRGLRAQLNPHFLFNCLNSLRELIIEDPRRAQAAVTQLSGLLRYSLQSGQTEQVLLEAEVQAVRDYLALEGIRFEERLHVEWNIDSRAAQVSVPPMLLQTMVENALKHGIGRRPEGGEVSIHARLCGSYLELEVMNSGELSEQPLGEGIGLRNARARLQLLYGDQSKITLESTAHGKVRAVGTIPVRQTGAAQ